MKNLKKLISVIIAVMMLVSSFATVAAADYADVESTNSYYKAIKVLSGLGIAKGDEAGNFNPTADVKRSEMVAFVCRMMGEEDIASGSATNAFTDVAASHWAAGYIAWGVNRGIINGMGDGTFAPDASVTYQDAVVMIMRALGFDRVAQRAENGGYPGGYMKLASQNKVLANAGYNQTKAATREIIAQLIFNGLTAPTVDVLEYGDSFENDKYVIYSGKTAAYSLRSLLTYTNEIAKVRVSVEDTYKLSDSLIADNGNMVKLVAATNCFYDDSETTVETAINTNVNAAGGFKAYVGESEIAEYAHKIVEAYLAYDEELNNVVVLAVVPDNATVSETVETDNFIGITQKNVSDITKGLVYNYKINATDSNSDAEKVEIAATASIYYNGKLAGTAVTAGAQLATLATKAAAASSVTFMKDKQADQYTAVFFTEYDYRVVDSVNVDKLRIKLTSGSINLDKEVRSNDKFIYNLFDAEGNAIELEDIKEGDVLNIVKPYNATAYTLNNAPSLDIYVTSETVTGTVDEEVVAGVKYVIGGEAYSIDGTTLKLGETGTFYISIDGKVIYKDATVAIGKNFGFITYVDNETKMGKNTWSLRIFDGEGNFNSYEIASTLRVCEAANVDPWAGAITGINWLDGYVYTANTTRTVDQVMTRLQALNLASSLATAQAQTADRFVTFNVDSEGKINEIRLTNGAGAATHMMSTSITNGRFDASFGEYDGKDINEAPIFVIPAAAYKWTNATTAITFDEELLEIASFEDIADDDQFSSVVYQTATDYEEFAITAALASSAPAKKYPTAPLAVVQKIGTRLNADNQQIASITLVQSGEVKSVAVKYGVNHGLTIGDIFQYQVNANGEITQTKVVVNVANTAGEVLALAAAGADESNDADAIYEYREDKYGFAFGYVVDVADGIKLGSSLTFDADGNVDKVAGFGATTTIKLVEDAAYTYAGLEYAGVAKAVPELSASKVIDIADVEATADNQNIYGALVRINDAGRATDVVVIDFANNAGKLAASLVY